MWRAFPGLRVFPHIPHSVEDVLCDWLGPKVADEVAEGAPLTGAPRDEVVAWRAGRRAPGLCVPAAMGAVPHFTGPSRPGLPFRETANSGPPEHSRTGSKPHSGVDLPWPGKVLDKWFVGVFFVQIWTLGKARRTHVEHFFRAHEPFVEKLSGPWKTRPGMCC